MDILMTLMFTWRYGNFSKDI